MSQHAVAAAWQGAALDEVLGRLSGFQVDDRLDCLLDERLSIRGIEARAQFGVRGVRVIVQQITTAHPELWDPMCERDGGHPSAMGAYLAALAIYHAITHQSPVGLPHDRVPHLSDSAATVFQHAVLQ